MGSLSEAWWDVSAHGEARQFHGESPDPFKENKFSPIRGIPGCNHVGIIKTDMMHGWNLGIGGGLAAGAIVSMCKLKAWRGRSIQARLDWAYESFSTWCCEHGKSPSITSFDKQKFKLMKTLALHRFSMIFQKGWALSFGLRTAAFVEGPQRAHDVGLFCKWLGGFLQGFDMRNLASWPARLAGFQVLRLLLPMSSMWRF